MEPHLDNNPEILAPAGDFASLKAAVYAGADAVYLAGKSYGARAKAGNFDNDELKKAVQFCHLFDVKIFLTFNTLIKPSEYSDAIQNLENAVNCGIDAVIIQDFVFLKTVKESFPDLPIHLSTQAGIHNVYGAIAAKKMGVSRIILSRETLPEDISEIKSETGLELEFFIHGAFCVGFSGNCYFSSMVAGLSGNRGKCLQLCRKEYLLNDNRGYYLSTKDLYLNDKILLLKDLGVDSFKIEGRMRRPEYVSAAVCHYRNILNNVKNDDSILALYNRGDGCAAYIADDKENVIYSGASNHIGQRVGTVKSVKGNTAQVSTTIRPSGNDLYKFFNGEKEVGYSLSSNQNLITFKGNVKSGDTVRLASRDFCLTKVKSDKLLNVEINFMIDCGCVVKIESGGLIYNYQSNEIIPQMPKSAPLSYDDIFDCFSKTGDYGVSLSSLKYNKSVFIPKSQLNMLRRGAYNAFLEYVSLLKSETFRKELRLKDEDCLSQDDVFLPADFLVKANKSDITIMAAVSTVGAIAKIEKFVDYVVFSPNDYNEKIILEAIDELSDKSKFFLNISNVARGRDLVILKKLSESNKIKNVVANNLYTLELFKDKNCILGPELNIINPDFPYRKILSYEYDGRDYGDNFVYVYGDMGLMTYCHCPKKSFIKDCKDCSSLSADMITDVAKNTFKLNRTKLHYCYHKLLNGVVTNITNRCETLGITHYYIDLIDKSDKECYNILSDIRKKSFVDEKGNLGYTNKKLD